MEKIDAISVPFYKFTAEDALVKEIQEEMKTTEFVPETTYENGYVYHNYYNENLFEFFNKSIKEFKNVYFHADVEFPIVDCWANKYGRMNKLNRHMHSNSIICGLYYVTTHVEKQAATIFEFDNPWIFLKPLINSFNITANHGHVQPLMGEIMPVAGTLILFPPALFHYMKPITKFKEFRYSIAFNTFASGNISMNRSSVLSINTQSVEDRLKK